MRHSSSHSIPPSSASRSPYASFFDLESVFRCGCTSDVEGFRDTYEESEHECLSQKPLRQALHDEKEDDETDFHMESARDYVERMSKSLASMEENERDVSFSKHNPKKYSRQVSTDSETSITTVFRLSTSSTSTINSRYPSLKHTDSDSTQETVDISDDELSLCSEEDEEEIPQETTSGPVSILRRKEKLGAITAASGSAVTFCPTTVFPDPNAIPQKRKKVKRLSKEQKLQIFVPAHGDHLPLELRRLERRAQQNQYSYDLWSPSSDILLPSESFYVFR
jgi:hypothetical protein